MAYRTSNRRGEPQHTKLIIISSTVAVIFLFFFIGLLSGGGIRVGATEIVVVENTYNGTLDTLESGTYIWPFSRNSPNIPFFTKKTRYDLRFQDIQVTGIEAGADSPGNPTVYYNMSTWVRPNPEKITILHRLYGKKYVDKLVKNVWIEVLKDIQGKKEFDYVATNRDELAKSVATNLELRMEDTDGEALVLVERVAITNYDYSPETNAYLNTINQKTYEKRAAEQQLEINLAQQEASKVQADTDFIVKKRNAEADAAALEAQAEGEANAIKIKAEGEANAIIAKAEAESDAVTMIAKSVKTTGTTYEDYLTVQKWNGELPYITSGTIPLINLPAPAPQ